MGDKNESIFLWLLEEDRKKNRAGTPKETCEYSALQSQSTAHSSRFNHAENCEDKNRQITYTENTDLEQLMKEKTNLEIESHRLDEQQKELDTRARTLCESVIKETKKRNLSKQHAVNQLRERIGSMEARLGLENAIYETKVENDKKQQEVSHLRELIGALDSQFNEISLSDASAECKTDKVGDSNYS